MSFTALTSAEILAGQPTRQELFTKLKADLDDHEDRMTALEAGVNSFRPIEFDLIGFYSSFGSIQTAVLYDRLNFDITILAARLICWTAGSSGTTEVDVLYKRGSGAWTSIFSTRPSLASSAGDAAISTNQVLAVTSLLAGDLMRVDIKSVQVQGQNAQIAIEYSK